MSFMMLNVIVETKRHKIAFNLIQFPYKYRAKAWPYMRIQDDKLSIVRTFLIIIHTSVGL